jgi:diphthamide synthase (EF-2-diphthine--ammonia ligase)
LRAQADAAGLPLTVVNLPWPCSNERYEAEMAATVAAARADGVTVMGFGDLFLEDIRAYRTEKLRGTGVRPVFPLWGLPTAELARDMIAGGMQARLTCVDPRKVPRELAGRAFDEALLSELPDGVDPCGEHGEFHTFAHAGPMFRAPVPIVPGEVVERDGFVFADFTLQGAAP